LYHDAKWREASSGGQQAVRSVVHRERRPIRWGCSRITPILGFAYKEDAEAAMTKRANRELIDTGTDKRYVRRNRRGSSRSSTMASRSMRK